jgi:hypothetical protein
LARLRLGRRFGVIGLGNPEIPGQKNWKREYAALFSRPVCLQFGTERGGKRARAWRIENSLARGRDTRTLLEGEWEKAFWCRGGDAMWFCFPPIRRLPLVPGSGNLLAR